MLESIEIQGFRGIRSAKVGPLGPVVVVTGDNASGKTTFLEAVLLLYARTSPVPVSSLQMHRGVGPLDLDGLFHGYGEFGQSAIFGLFAGGGTANLTIIGEPGSLAPASQGASGAVGLAEPKLTFRVADADGHFEAMRVARSTPSGMEVGTDNPKDPAFNALLLHPVEGPGSPDDGKRFGEVVVHRREKDVVAALQRFDVRVRDVHYVSPGGNPRFYMDIGLDQRVPCGILGGGLNRLLQMLIGVEFCHGGALLVDEIENGLYYEHMEAVLGSLIDAGSSSGTQLFISTHSRELLQALARAAQREGRPELTVVRGNRSESGEITFGSTSGLKALKAIELAEVR